MYMKGVADRVLRLKSFCQLHQRNAVHRAFKIAIASRDMTTTILLNDVNALADGWLVGGKEIFLKI